MFVLCVVKSLLPVLGLSNEHHDTACHKHQGNADATYGDGDVGMNEWHFARQELVGVFLKEVLEGIIAHGGCRKTYQRAYQEIARIVDAQVDSGVAHHKGPY